MRKFVFYISFFYFLFSTILNAQEQLFSKELLLTHNKNLSSDAFEGRRTGTKGAIKAKKYIINEFSKLGVKPLKENYEQPFLFSEYKKDYHGINVLGLIKGTVNPNKYIVISAHYDHEGIKNGEIYNGSDDNASGVSALFSFAEYFKTHPPKHSVILAAFDGEELGLQGSMYFVDHSIVPLKSILLNVNMDMISRSDKKELYVVGTKSHPVFKSVFTNYKASCKDIKLVIGHDGYDDKENWLYSSDHTPFYKKGMPFLYFGVEDHEDYHEPTDDFENIHPEFYYHAVKEIITIFKQIDSRSF